MRLGSRVTPEFKAHATGTSDTRFKQWQTLQCTHPSIFSLYAQYLSFLGTAITISRNLAVRRNIHSKAILLHITQPSDWYNNPLILRFSSIWHLLVFFDCLIFILSASPIFILCDRFIFSLCSHSIFLPLERQLECWSTDLLFQQILAIFRLGTVPVHLLSQLDCWFTCPADSRFSG